MTSTMRKGRFNGRAVSHRTAVIVKSQNYQTWRLEGHRAGLGNLKRRKRQCPITVFISA